MDGRRLALIIIGSEYQDPGLRRLHTPVQDVRSLAGVLGDPDIGNFDVQTLINEPAQLVNEAIEDFFAVGRPKDLLLLYFSCHCLTDETGDLYFAMSDTRLQRLAATAVPADFIDHQMSDSRNRQIVLLLDCSYAGAFERGTTAKAGRAVRIGELFGGAGRGVISASGAMEYAFEDAGLADVREQPASAFTRAVVEGLETGDADRNHDGLIDLNELYDYVYDRVREASPNQTPGKWIFTPAGIPRIARRPRPGTTSVALPTELRDAVDSPTAIVRLSAVDELERLLTSGSAGEARAAGQALERLADDHSRRVAAAATAALHARSGPELSGPATTGQIPSSRTTVRSSPRSLQPPPLVDNDVRFTVYRPGIMFPRRWASLLVFAHKTELVMDPDRGSIDPVEEVEARARAHFAGNAALPVVEDARRPLVRGGLLRVTPDLPGVDCNPEAAEFEWWEPVHEVAFRLRAGPDFAGRSVRGSVRIWCGPLIISELSIAIPVGEGDAAATSSPVAESVRRYRKIFPSYSHHDRAVVEQFAVAARVLGDQYLQDVFALRAGERWEPRLRELIEAADVFQLFWSRNSMLSPYCRQEWEHALALRRRLFVRPLYWEEPLPEDPTLQLPPTALRELHFVKLPLGGGEVDRPAPPPTAAAAEPELRPMLREDARRVSDADHERAQPPRWEAPSRAAPRRRSAPGRRLVAVVATIAAGLLFTLLLRACLPGRPPAHPSPPTSTGQKTVAVPGTRAGPTPEHEPGMSRPPPGVRPSLTSH